MIHQAELDRVRHLFAGEHLRFVLDAMIAGNSPVRAWADDRAALIWDGSYSIYLAGPLDQPAAWRDLLDREIAPAGRGFLKAHITEEAAATVLAGYPLQRRQRVLYRLGRPLLTAHPPAGYRISPISNELGGLANFTDVVAEIKSCWPSLDHFDRAGFGFVAHDADKIVSWCTAECVSPGYCGIGIETLAEYRNHGLATATAIAFVQHCLTYGITPYWDAWADNQPSIAVAKKIGFDQVETYQIYAG